MKLISLSSIVARRVVISIFAAFIFAALAPQTGFAQSDPDIGTWKLNLAKSKYIPGPAPKSSTLVVEATGQGMERATTEGTDAQGKPTKAVFVVGYDGKPYPVTGVNGYDASSYKRVDTRTMEYTRTKAGKVIQTGTRVLSTDGKTSTFTTKGVNATGQQFTNVAVYEKQ